jgi:hypothetical protein
MRTRHERLTRSDGQAPYWGRQYTEQETVEKKKRLVYLE